MSHSKLHIMTILGTRPEIIRLSRVMPLLDQYVHHTIVYTNQSYDYELSEIFFKELSLRKPDYMLSVKADTVGGQIGNILSQSETILTKEKPDGVLVLGDTNSVLASIIAKRMHIPVFHMEAGNRSFDPNVPEELNRRIVDHVSDINLAYTEHSRRYLEREGIHPGKIYVTGSPLAEVFAHYREQIEGSPILEKLDIRSHNYFLVSTHREENVDTKDRLVELFDSLTTLGREYDRKVIVSLHPRTKRRIEEFGISFDKRIEPMKPFGYFDYMKLQKHARCVLSDSGSIQEEATIFQFPAVQIRLSSERPESFDTGSIILTGFNRDRILDAVDMAVASFDRDGGVLVPDQYRDTTVSTKVVKLIMGLTGIKKHHTPWW